jgi:hypothetical protein
MRFSASSRTASCLKPWQVSFSTASTGMVPSCAIELAVRTAFHDRQTTQDGRNRSPAFIGRPSSAG